MKPPIQETAVQQKQILEAAHANVSTQDLPNCTRVEVIDQKSRSYANWYPTTKVRLSIQDDCRTVKIFID